MNARLGRTGANVALAIAACLAALLLVEAMLQLSPGLLPAGVYAASRVEPLLGMRTYAGSVLYVEDEVVRREPNSLGYLDVEHSLDPAPGVTRIGFFGVCQ